jgi:cytoskeletal protein CcmA (bactofilin family)
LIALITIFVILLLHQTFVALRNTYHSVTLKMTYIPPEKEPLPSYDPPPYAPTDPSVSSSRGAEAEFPSAEEEKARLRKQLQAQVPAQAYNGESSFATQKTPQSNAIKSSVSVSLTGPLEILGQVSSSSSVTLSSGIRVQGKIDSSSSVTLSDNIHVEGKVDASANVTLSDNIRVEGKVDASGSIKLSGNVFVEGKLDASGSVELENVVTVVGKVKSSGNVTLTKSIKVGENVDCSGSIVIKDDVVVDGDVSASGRIRIEGSKLCVFGGKLKSSVGIVVDGDAVVE